LFRLLEIAVARLRLVLGACTEELGIARVLLLLLDIDQVVQLGSVEYQLLLDIHYLLLILLQLFSILPSDLKRVDPMLQNSHLTLKVLLLPRHLLQLFLHIRNMGSPHLEIR
jgi:hypothetical protein